MDRKLIIPKGYPFEGKELKEEISPENIQIRNMEIGEEISKIYRDKNPIIIGVLNGAFLFMADLVRTLDIEYEVDFIKISSYGDNIETSGTVTLLKDISANITGRHVIVVEDIVDTGMSLRFLKSRLEQAKPSSLKFVTFLYKINIAKLNFDIDWIGFNIDEKYYIGYGLDLKQKYRGLPGIYTINN